ncbi:MAG: homocysteine S-methyltransferase family protein [Anaerolineales bacterium]|nr:homocysteine S-methyltransferase family protein [Anaerolineales bacterium]
MAKWQDLIAVPGLILADGAMGTMLFEAGLQFGDSPERWNVEHPERVQAVHRAYLEAGSRLLLTNTFGGNRWRLSLHGLESRGREFVEAGARNARASVEAAGGRALVAGDIGPSGSLLAPLGELDEAEAVAGFAEQAEALLEGGVDVIWIETMSDLGEVATAVRGVRQASESVPILATMTFDTRGHTMMGVSPEKAVQQLLALGAAAIGGNCGNGPEEILEVVERMRAVSPQAIVIAKANAGLPTLVGGHAVYAASPESMAEYARAAAGRGARIIGACCGSTPAHLQAMGEVLRDQLAA